METVNLINQIIALIVLICCLHQYLYFFVPLFRKHKPHGKTSFHSYAVLISARNEENVIGELINSIKCQNYPSELIDIFVVADNCTDKTAEVARKAGAVVWERFNKEQVGKGYALNFLLKKIDNAYPDSPFDAFVVFDADNLLDENYFSEMNKTFSDGHQIITSYRNTKNFSDNWITSGYGLMFLREAKYINNSRMLLNSSSAISGTAFLFSKKIKEEMDGWNFHLLTEDIQFTAYQVMNGHKVAYCPTAILYDEQPITFKQSYTQRLRWAKGYLQVFSHYGPKLFFNIFRLRSFSCYDFFTTLLPASLISVAAFLMNSVATIVGLCLGLDVTGTVMSMIAYFATIYIIFFAMGCITVISERKQIHCSTGKKIWSIITFPVFMFTYTPIGVIALFKKVEWKPIQHGLSKAKSVSDIVSVSDYRQSSEAAGMNDTLENQQQREMPVASASVAENAPSSGCYEPQMKVIAFETLEQQNMVNSVINTTTTYYQD